LRPPCELVVKHYLPVIRSLIARELMDDYKLNQMQIAKLLGITQPAVSNYLSLLRGEADKAFDRTEVREVAKKMASELVEGRLSLSNSIYTVCKLCVKLRSGGVTCSLHKEAVPELSAEECVTCSRLFAEETEPISERINVLNNLRSAILKLTESKEFIKLVPEVRTNLVMATSTATTEDEVAGIPGRITVVRERVKSLSAEPEFGASFHLAAVLIAVMQRDRQKRGAINIKFNEQIEKAMHDLGMDVHKFNRANLPSKANEKQLAVPWAVNKAADELGRIPDTLVDEGGYGVEPATYIFGSSATDVAEKAIKIANNLSHKSRQP
jgi:predicted fused transcriptional regulator/phosphomethylpyrimidine kinase/predicted transcriptional regulator